MKPSDSRNAPASSSYEDVRAWLLEVDPELVAAAADVDQTLLDSAARRSPLELLREASASARELLRLQALPRR
ncbi:MAG: hypothetical protein H6718_06555 [Polyangiaceae bacterium]|nr:hypothetical protein [Myxococcales bacterium]MCB9585040.1 hypothetical protein [Polyangiaceae bacterium]MCB9610069.1 hypothetical protein [Polyangiaceae bacterium]